MTVSASPRYPAGIDCASDAEDALGFVAIGGVQIPVDRRDLLGRGCGESGDDGVGAADGHVDTDVGGLDTGAVEFLVEVEHPVAQRRGGGVDVADLRDGV